MLPQHCHTQWWLCKGCWASERPAQHLVSRWGLPLRRYRRLCAALWSVPNEGWVAPELQTGWLSHLQEENTSNPAWHLNSVWQKPHAVNCSTQQNCTATGSRAKPANSLLKCNTLHPIKASLTVSTLKHPSTCHCIWALSQLLSAPLWSWWSTCWVPTQRPGRSWREARSPSWSWKRNRSLVGKAPSCILSPHL